MWKVLKATPCSATEVRAFLGLCSYYREFITNFAHHSVSLHALTEKNAPFCWTSQCQEALTYPKRALSNPPVVSFPRFHITILLLHRCFRLCYSCCPWLRDSTEHVSQDASPAAWWMGWLPRPSVFGLQYQPSLYNRFHSILPHKRSWSQNACQRAVTKKHAIFIYSRLSCWLCRTVDSDVDFSWSDIQDTLPPRPVWQVSDYTILLYRIVDIRRLIVTHLCSPNFLAWLHCQVLCPLNLQPLQHWWATVNPATSPLR